MDKGQALQAFWELFGLPAYEETSVPDDATLPYITYSSGYGALEEPIALQGDVWYRSTTWADCKRKTDEIGRKIGRGGTMMPYEGGALWVTRGTPFAQPLSDPDDLIRRMYINVMVEYLSQD